MTAYQLIYRSYPDNQLITKKFHVNTDTTAYLEAYARFLGVAVVELLSDEFTAAAAKDAMKNYDASDAFVLQLKNLDTNELLIDNLSPEELVS